MSEANLVIKLVQDAPNGYIPLNKLRKEYHSKYGKHLDRNKILKWIRSLPGVYVDNYRVTHSIHCIVDEGLAPPLRNTVVEGVQRVHSQSMTRSYAAVVTRKHLKGKKSRRTHTGVYVNNNPVKDFHIGAKNGLTRHLKADAEANLVIELVQDAPNGYLHTTGPVEEAVS